MDPSDRDGFQRKRSRWYVRLLRRLHDRSDAIFILGYIVLLGLFAWLMHEMLP